jgi:DNA-binding transcriptional LysR family regulator
MAPPFGITEVLPLMPVFLARYPAVTLDLELDNRAVDLVADGVDAAIGGGFELKPGVVSRELAPAHLVAVASPSYLEGKKMPRTPEDMRLLDVIAMRSPQSGRVKPWTMRNRDGDEAPLAARSRVFITIRTRSVAPRCSGWAWRSCSSPR